MVSASCSRERGKGTACVRGGGAACCPAPNHQPHLSTRAPPSAPVSHLQHQHNITQQHREGEGGGRAQGVGGGGWGAARSPAPNGRKQPHPTSPVTQRAAPSSCLTSAAPAQRHTATVIEGQWQLCIEGEGGGRAQGAGGGGWGAARSPAPNGGNQPHPTSPATRAPPSAPVLHLQHHWQHNITQQIFVRVSGSCASKGGGAGGGWGGWGAARSPAPNGRKEPYPTLPVTTRARPQLLSCICSTSTTSYSNCY